MKTQTQEQMREEEHLRIFEKFLKPVTRMFPRKCYVLKENNYTDGKCLATHVGVRMTQHMLRRRMEHEKQY